jgi:hypothetical protein
MPPKREGTLSKLGFFDNGMRLAGDFQDGSKVHPCRAWRHSPEQCATAAFLKT